MKPLTHSHPKALTLVEMVVVMTILIALAALVVPQMRSTSDVSQEIATRQTLTTVREAYLRYWLDTKYMTLPGPPATAAADTAGVDPALTNDEVSRFQMRWLFQNPETGTNVPSYNPSTSLGWNGPYVDRNGIYNADDVTDSASNFSLLYGNDPDVSDDGVGGPAVYDSFGADLVTLADGTIANRSRPIIIQAIESTNGTLDVRAISAGPDGLLDIPHDVASDALTDAQIGDDLFVAFTLRR